MSEVDRDLPAASSAGSGHFSQDYPWRVQIDRSAPRSEGQFDVIVIGTGIGGLGCGAFLSKRGYKVLVLEQRGKAGGFFRSFDKDGFYFNTGAVQVTGLWSGGPLARFLDDLGFNQDDYFVATSLDYRVDGSRYAPQAGVTAFAGELVRDFPQQKAAVEAFFEDAVKAHDEWQLASQIYGVLQSERGPAPQSQKFYQDWSAKSLRQKLEDHFDHERIMHVIGSILSQPYGNISSTGGLAALHSFSFIRHGSHAPREGAGKLARALVAQIESAGNSVLLERMVDSIVIEGGAVAGVVSGEDTYRAPAVVSNANIKSTLLELVGPGNLARPYLEAISGLKMHRSYCMTFLGVNLDLSTFPTVSLVESEGDGSFVLASVNSNADSSYAPEGQASVTLIMEAPYAEFPERETPEYEAIKQAWADRMIAVAEQVIPGMAAGIVVRHAATPKTLERYTITPQGSALGVAWSTAGELPAHKTPIEGLYLGGASTYPGAGVDHALVSGLLCARDIHGGEQG